MRQNNTCPLGDELHVAGEMPATLALSSPPRTFIMSREAL